MELVVFAFAGEKFIVAERNKNAVAMTEIDFFIATAKNYKCLTQIPKAIEKVRKDFSR